MLFSKLIILINYIAYRFISAWFIAPLTRMSLFYLQGLEWKSLRLRMGETDSLLK